MKDTHKQYNSLILIGYNTGLPVFFLYYNSRFNPQNHILTLNCDDLIINIAAIAARNLLGCRIAGKRVDLLAYTKAERSRVIEYVNENTEECLEMNMQKGVDELMTFLFGGNAELGNYLKMDLHDFSFELKNAVRNGCLESVLAIK